VLLELQRTGLVGPLIGQLIGGVVLDSLKMISALGVLSVVLICGVNFGETMVLSLVVEEAVEVLDIEVTQIASGVH
jgi:hypothetical protein